MNRLFAISTKSPKHIMHAIFPYKSFLEFPMENTPFSWGVAIKEYQNGIFRKKRPYSLEDVNFFELMQSRNLTHCIGNISKTPKEHSFNDTMPFKYRNWYFSVLGESKSFSVIKDWIVGSLPSFLKRSIASNTEQEHIFYLLLSYLYDTGLINSYDISLNALAASITSTFDLWNLFIKEISDENIRAVIALTNGNLTAIASTCDNLVGYQYIQNIPAPCPFCLANQNHFISNEHLLQKSHNEVDTFFAVADENLNPKEIGLLPLKSKTVLIFSDNQLHKIPVL